MQHTRWCRTMAGEEWARIHSWGNQPDRKGEYEAMSPCRHVDLPQTLFEPIIVTRAVNKGWKVRFDSTWVEYERDSPTGPITSHDPRYCHWEDVQDSIEVPFWV